MITIFDRLKDADNRGAVDDQTHVMALNIVEVREVLREIESLREYVKVCEQNHDAEASERVTQEWARRLRNREVPFNR